MYLNLKTEMIRKGIKQKDIAQLLGMSESAISEKINGNGHFVTKNSIVIRDNFFKSLKLEYLFEYKER